MSSISFTRYLQQNNICKQPKSKISKNTTKSIFTISNQTLSKTKDLSIYSIIIYSNTYMGHTFQLNIF